MCLTCMNPNKPNNPNNHIYMYLTCMTLISNPNHPNNPNNRSYCQDEITTLPMQKTLAHANKMLKKKESSRVTLADLATIVTRALSQRCNH